MTPQEIDEILERYLKDECTTSERQQVEEWLRAIGKESGELDTKTQSVVEQRLWAKLDHTTHDRQTYWKLGRIAAGLLILIVSSFSLINYFNAGNSKEDAVEQGAKMLHFANTDNTPKDITMKDGSVITLQPGSNVRFAEVFHDKREVYLSGEAFFEVTRNVNQPFLVYANEVTTKVLGTSFLIKAYKQEKEITVAVKTGKVSVFTKPLQTQEPIIVTPNQQVVYNRNADLAMKMLVDEPQVVVQEPPLKASYKNAPVIDIFNALEKTYGIKIEYDANALSYCTLTSADIAEEGIYEQIEIICNAIGARYKRYEFSILIESEGCKKNL